MPPCPIAPARRPTLNDQPGISSKCRLTAADEGGAAAASPEMPCADLQNLPHTTEFPWLDERRRRPKGYDPRPNDCKRPVRTGLKVWLSQ
jgi:hypothetical protein